VGCAYAVHAQKSYQIWGDDGSGFCSAPPWPCGRDVLFDSLNLPAELSCYQSLGWPLPAFALDLLIEYRLLRNGILYKKASRKLADVMHRENLMWIDPDNKDEMHELILRAGDRR
jgi:DNA polymerase I